MSGGQIARFIFGVAAFGVLMGLRGELQSLWARTVVASLAGAVLGVLLLSLNKRK